MMQDEASGSGTKTEKQNDKWGIADSEIGYANKRHQHIHEDGQHGGEDAKREPDVAHHLTDEGLWLALYFLLMTHPDCDAPTNQCHDKPQIVPCGIAAGVPKVPHDEGGN